MNNGRPEQGFDTASARRNICQFEVNGSATNICNVRLCFNHFNTMEHEKWAADARRQTDYMLGNARELRKNMTPQEKQLWYQYLRPSPIHWYKQRIIRNYILDFYCPSAKLAVELDGWQHQEPDGQYADQVRDRALASEGVLVLRFSNPDVNYRFRRVCAEIEKAVRERQRAGENSFPEGRRERILEGEAGDKV